VKCVLVPSATTDHTRDWRLLRPVLWHGPRRSFSQQKIAEDSSMAQQMNLFAQLDDQERSELLDHVYRMQHCAERGIAVRPDPKSIGQFVRFQRHMR
jgi:hypothetical protein